jgi:hypothetical protein
MKKIAMTLSVVTLLLALAAPALAWHIRVRPTVLLATPALVVRPAPVVVRPRPVVVRPAPVVVTQPTPVCPRGWHWNAYRDHCRPNY